MTLLRLFRCVTLLLSNHSLLTAELLLVELRLTPLAYRLNVVVLHFLVLEVDLLVQAVDAPTEARASSADLEALAVLLHATGFSAVATAHVHHRIFLRVTFVLAFECIRIFLERFFDHFVSNLAIRVIIEAALALAVRAARLATREARAVQFEAAGVRASAARRRYDVGRRFDRLGHFYVLHLLK